MPRPVNPIVTLPFTALCFLMPLARAQDFEESLSTAVGHYQKEEYAQTKKHLEQAVAILNAKRAEQWTAFFPMAANGWQTSPVEIKTPLLGGESIERKYVKGESSISVSIDQDGMGTFALEMARQVLVTPGVPQARKDAMVEKNGVQEIGGFLRMTKEEGNTASINVRICQRTAVQFTGDKAAMADVAALANAMDCSRLFFRVVKGKAMSGPIGKPAKAADDIVGKWAGDVDGDRVLFEFRRDMSMAWTMTLPEQTQPTTLPARYLVDYEKSPIQLEILDVPVFQKPILGILKFSPDGSMALEVNAGTDGKAATRPVSLAGATTFRRVD